MLKLNVFFLDNTNNNKGEIIIFKPKTYQGLLKQLKKEYENIEENYDIFVLNKNNEEIEIKDEQDYLKVREK